MEIGTVKPTNIEEEMRGAYLDYAMSVITARALPDVRDGLKPVQRRILYAMDELGLRHTSPYKKSARIVGEVLGKYHPHGDAPVYEAMVRMAQDFSMRYPLVDGQGNFGSVDGDPPAAMRYTEARMAAIAEEMLSDIDKNTVDFAPNFDGTLKEPTVLPAKLPNLLLNGSSGIAVGMATNIPPHNLNEVVDATILMIDHFGNCMDAGVPFELMWPRVLNTAVAPEVLANALKSLKPQLAERVKAELVKGAKHSSTETQLEALLNVVDEMVDIPPDRLLEVIKGPDFPTAGIILGDEGIKNAYVTGHGRITIRAKAHVEEMRGNRHQIIVTQLPFQVNKASLLEKIAELVRDRRVEGISELRDESDRQGMRIVIELRRDTQPTQILNQLFKYTAMQSAFSINMLALVDGQPRVLTLKMILLHYINYRKEIITRRTIFDLERARHRAHILEGLKIALDNLDEVISTIRKSRDAETARVALMKSFKLTEIQAQAILDMQLRRLAALERKKIIDELAETRKLIAYLEDLLAHPGKILFLIKDELAEIKGKYGDVRRTRITAEAAEEFSEEDLIPDQEVVISVSAKGYVKRVPADSFKLQKRAKAITGTVTREEDAPQMVIGASTLDQILFVTNRGRAYRVKAHELPDVGRQARGLPLSNFFSLQPEEKAVGAVSLRNLDRSDHYVLYVTRNGDVKRVGISEYNSARAAGIVALNIPEGDELVFVGLGTGKSELMVFSEKGQAIRFKEDEVRPSGRTSGGIRAIRLKNDDHVAAASVVRGDQVVIVTKNGYHKRCSLTEFPLHSRGGAGVTAQKVTAKTGPLAGATVASDVDEVLAISAGGLMARWPTDVVPQMGRSTQGTPIDGLEKGDNIVHVARVENRENPPKPIVGSEQDGGSGGLTPSPSKTKARGTRSTRGSKSSTAAKPARESKSKAIYSDKDAFPKASKATDKESAETVAPPGRPAPAKVTEVKTVSKASRAAPQRPREPTSARAASDGNALGPSSASTPAGGGRRAAADSTLQGSETRKQEDNPPDIFTQSRQAVSVDITKTEGSSARAAFSEVVTPKDTEAKEISHNKSKGKSPTLWGSIASSIARSVSGEQKGTKASVPEPAKGIPVKQGSLPLFPEPVVSEPAKEKEPATPLTKVSKSPTEPQKSTSAAKPALPTKSAKKTATQEKSATASTSRTAKNAKATTPKKAAKGKAAERTSAKADSKAKATPKVPKRPTR